MNSKRVLAAAVVLAVLLCPLAMQGLSAGETDPADTLDSVAYDGRVLSLEGTSVQADGTPVHVELLDPSGSPLSVGLAYVSGGSYSLKMEVVGLSVDTYAVKCTFTPLGSPSSILSKEAELGGSLLSCSFADGVLRVGGTAACPDGTPVHIEVTDTDGKTVAVGLTRTASGAYSANIDVGPVPTGTYAVRCTFTPMGEPGYSVSSQTEMGGCTVTYDSNGGSAQTERSVVPEGTQADLSRSAGERAGYRFLGWALESDASVPLGSLTVETDVVLYAVWEKVPGGDPDVPDVPDIPPAPKVVPVKGVSIDRTEVTMGLGTEIRLDAVFDPADATNRAVTWSTADTGVVDLNGGNVKAIGVGTATVTVRTDDGGYTASTVITVVAQHVPAVEPSVTVEGDRVEAQVSTKEVKEAIEALGPGAKSLEVSVPEVPSAKDPQVSVSIPGSGVSAVSGAGLALDISTPVADLSMDPSAVRSAEAMGGDLVLSVSKAGPGDLNDAQRKAAGGSQVFLISLTAGGASVGKLGGTLTVSVPYDLNGADPSKLAVFCIDDGGNLERFQCTYGDGKVTFSTPHLSVWSVGIEETEPVPVPDEGDGEGTSYALYAVAAVLAVIVVIAAMVLVRRKA